MGVFIKFIIMLLLRCWLLWFSVLYHCVDSVQLFMKYI